ncbi:hypothetical protein BGZ70_003719 [Mortierella alpina]|uniref:Uncharacterized protein n=1 Tax=Mortierella alpina TaxID=64518 RepID=A0A9P6IRW7_MORAP|nr:hypothetical protein BGZ70_003719 [Mortierella alpina]
MVVNPKMVFPSLIRPPEVKNVSAATANDALDVISEYLLHIGRIGVAKLPLIKELREFLLVQTQIENADCPNFVNWPGLGPWYKRRPAKVLGNHTKEESDRASSSTVGML